MMSMIIVLQVIAFAAAVLRMTGTRDDEVRRKSSFARRLYARDCDDSDRAARLLSTPHVDPLLVVGPATVLYNWVEELQTWGYFRVG